ncbi:ComEA family DNA-binding protein [Moellerella wisconsensis]|uniref:Secreted protein n=1 Tax=Moellerella wisconsensis ATCC 35017 TaxID=1354267 RepID=A0A0N0Z8L7_9GAMM|nr:ComEA family DNA-binding protein [Moellerella wisconsensis]KPD03519.1 secreted protein [Moellerella wisconsensis ATCC 35017]VFS50950.1 competence protein ComEA helix-hairpin-helix repeat region [Moellerella wisconsensis]
MLWNKQRKLGTALIFITSLLSVVPTLVLADKAKADTSSELVSKLISKNKPDKSESDTLTKGSAAVSATSSDLVNINKADADELALKLSGIGIRKAQAIIDYREKFGDFKSIENLQEVNGIGPLFIENNRDKLKL